MRYFFILFLLIYFYGCKENNNHRSSLSITIDKNIEISVPENVYYYSFLNQVIRKNDTLYLLRQRNHTKEQGIDFINLDKNIFIKSIMFPKEGDKGVGRLASFYYVSKDSILVINQKSVLTSDETGTIKFRKTFIKDDDYFPTLVSNISQSFIKKNMFYFCKISFQAPTNNTFFETNNLYAFNLKNYTGKDVPNTAYSDMFLDKCWSYYDTDFISTFNEKSGELLFTFPIDDNIYRYGIDQEKIIETVNARSKYKKQNNKPVECKSIRSFDEKRHNYTNFYYALLIYDKYKDLYYRISLLPEQNYSSNINYKRFNRKFIISVLDKNLKIIGESDILNTNHEFVYYDWFITDEGLWISTNNPENKNFNENTLSYALLKISI